MTETPSAEMRVGFHGEPGAFSEEALLALLRVLGTYVPHDAGPSAPADPARGT